MSKTASDGVVTVGHGRAIDGFGRLVTYCTCDEDAPRDAKCPLHGTVVAVTAGIAAPSATEIGMSRSWFWIEWSQNPRPQPAERSDGQWWLIGLSKPVDASEVKVLAPIESPFADVR